MATPKLQPTRAIAVIMSPLNNIPNPALLIVSSTLTQQEQDNIFTDLTVDFIALGVKAGDILYATGAGAATITDVLDEHTFSINAPNDPLAPPIVVSIPYSLYNGADDNPGCMIYVGTGGDLETVTAGGDVAIYTNVQAGTFIPVQTVSVTGGTADNIVALF